MEEELSRIELDRMEESARLSDDHLSFEELLEQCKVNYNGWYTNYAGGYKNRFEFSECNDTRYRVAVYTFHPNSIKEIAEGDSYRECLGEIKSRLLTRINARINDLQQTLINSREVEKGLGNQ